MSTQTQLVVVPPHAISFHGARVAEAPAPILTEAPTDDVGRQMAVGVARMVHDGQALVAITLVLGTSQTTLTLGPAETNQLCHQLADAVLWQNEQLRLTAGQAVH